MGTAFMPSIESADTWSSITLADGRSLAYQLYGAPGGTPVYFLHGFPGSRTQAELVQQDAIAANVCLVSMDRPGFGRSDHDPKRTIESTCRDIIALADFLGHEKFAAVGVSCGGAYALGLACQYVTRVQHVGLMAGIGPMDARETVSRQLPILRTLFRLARTNQYLATPILAMDRLLFRTNPDRALKILSKLLSRPDRRVLRRSPDTARIFGNSLSEAYEQGLAGALREAHLIGSPRPYRLDEIRTPVEVFQGGMDYHVPFDMGCHIAENVRDGRMHYFPYEGHLSILPRAFSACLRKIIAHSRQPTVPGRTKLI